MKTVNKRFPFNKSRCYTNDGFTLIELMVSVSIIAIVIVSLFRMQAGSVGLVESAKFYSLSPILAGKVLEKIGCAGHCFKIKNNEENFEEFSGNFSNHYPGIVWKCRIIDVDSSPGEKGGSFAKIKADKVMENTRGLKKILIDIIYSDKTYEITTFRYIPL